MEAIEKSYRACEQFAKYNPIIKTRLQMRWAQNNGYPLHDSCLFFPNFTFMYNIWKAKDPVALNKLLPCDFPSFKTSKTCIGGYVANWAVLKNSPHCDEAVKLMMFWCRPDVAEKWVRYTRCPSGVKGNLATSTYGTDQFENYIYTMAQKYQGHMVQDIDLEYIAGNKNRSVQFHATEVMEGKLTTEQAMKNLKSQLVH
jgi:ABC-type glycerol-3-phosphate transport system substrate-binding protein